MDEILGDLYERKPDVIGFSCYIWNWQMTKELMVEVKKLLPKTDIFLGGPEVSYEAEKIMEQYGRDNEENGNGPVIRGISLGKVKKPSASWPSIMQRRAACLENGVPNRMMAAIRIYRSQTERVQTLPEPWTGSGRLRIFRDFFLIPDTPE